MIRVDEDDVAEARMRIQELLDEAEIEPLVAIAAMMHLSVLLSSSAGPPQDDVLDWAVRRLDDEGESE